MAIAEVETASLMELVAKVVREHDDIEEARAALHELLDFPDEWMLHPKWQYAGPMIERAERELIHDCRHQQRSKAKNGRQPSAVVAQRPCAYQNHPAAVAVMKEVVTRSILDSFLVGSKKLGDVYRDELSEWGEREMMIGRGHIRNGLFAAAIVRHMPNNCRVRDGLTEEAVEKVKRHTYTEKE